MSVLASFDIPFKKINSDNELYWLYSLIETGVSIENPVVQMFISKNKDKLDWGIISSTTKGLDWMLCNSEYQKYVKWDKIPYNSYHFDNFFYKKYMDQIDWTIASEKIPITVSFIEKFKDKINWKSLSKNPTLKIELIEKYKNKIDWEIIVNNKHNLTLNFFVTYKDEFAKYASNETLEYLAKKDLLKNNSTELFISESSLLYNEIDQINDLLQENLKLKEKIKSLAEDNKRLMLEKYD